MISDQRAELLPCPWCGRPASIIGDWNMERLVCSDRMGECPGATVDLPCHRPERRYASIAAWNRRTPASAPAAPAVGDDLMSLMDRAVLTMPYELAMSSELSRIQFYERVQSLIARAALTRDAASERALDEEIANRDRAEEWADKLADAIAKLTGADIGEHTSANCPWSNSVEAAEAKLAAQAQTGEARWQPIETAPKNCEVLVWRQDSGPFIAKFTDPGGVLTDRELDGAEFPDDFEEWWSDAYGWQEGNERPTHWIPLPAAPADHEEKGDDRG